jgi:hypothetical protein
MEEEFIDLIGTVKVETEMAILVEFAEGEVWLPKSQLEDWPDLGEEGDVVMPEWLAIDKGLA